MLSELRVQQLECDRALLTFAKSRAGEHAPYPEQCTIFVQLPDCFSSENKAKISCSRFVSGFSKTSDFDPTFTGSGLVKTAWISAVAAL
jgi:hypothetical protein